MRKVLSLAVLAVVLMCLENVDASAQTGSPPQPAVAAPAPIPNRPAAAPATAPRVDGAADKAAQEKAKQAADALLDRHNRAAQRALQGICSGCLDGQVARRSAIRRDVERPRPRRLRRNRFDEPFLDEGSAALVAPAIFVPVPRPIPAPGAVWRTDR